jgi:hypothetical protein
MRTWITILAIRLGFVKLICLEPSYDSITRYRMKKIGLRFKDLGRALKVGEDAIVKVVSTERKTLRSRIDRYLTKLEKKK